MTERASLIGARATIAGCVAVALYGVAATIGWFAAGTPEYVLGHMAVSVPVVFTATAAVRGLAGLLFKPSPNPAVVVLRDAGICIVLLVFIALVGSIGDSGGHALYSVIVGSQFLLPAVVVVSIVIEIVVHNAWLIRISVGLATVAGLAAVAIFAQSLTT